MTGGFEGPLFHLSERKPASQVTARTSHQGFPKLGAPVDAHITPILSPPAAALTSAPPSTGNALAPTQRTCSRQRVHQTHGAWRGVMWPDSPYPQIPKRPIAESVRTT